MTSLAFLVLAHKNPTQLQRLVDYLLENDCHVFIHVDKKSSAIFKEFIKRNSGNNKVKIYCRYKVYWGSHNQIKATFLLLNEAVDHSDFDFVSLISGQDIPIKPLKEFKTFLSQNTEKSFFEHAPLPQPENWSGNGGLDRMEYFWILNYSPGLGFIFTRLNKVIHFLQDKLKMKRKNNLNLYGGANWFTLNRQTAEYVTNFTKETAFFRKFRNTRCADEIILQTILMNSHLKDNFVNSNLRFIDWQNGPEYPRVFRSGDAESLLENKNYIARKFDEETDNEIINLIYKNI